MARKGIVSSGHYLATAAGFRILEQGGNAIDSGIAMCLCLNVLEPQQNGIGGEVPMLLHSARDRQVYAIGGVGWSPDALSIDWFRDNEISLIPGDGFLPACVPAVIDSCAVTLARFGTLSFAQVLAPAIELARDGFPVYRGLHDKICDNYERFRDRYPSTYELYCHEGRVPEEGELLRNPQLAAVLERISDAEKAARGRGRISGIDAGRDAFYRGDIANEIVGFAAEHPVMDATGKPHAGFLAFEDMAQWHASVEEPISYSYRGFEVHKCPTWTQGAVFLQQLALLSHFDLRKMAHNSSEYLHVLIECAKLAFADREAYYGDPLFDDVPLEWLLSRDYSLERAALIGSKASMELTPGRSGRRTPAIAPFDVERDNCDYLGIPSQRVPRGQTPRGHSGGTTHFDAADIEGNMIAGTPSGGWIESSPVIAGLGFSLGTRGQMFYLNRDRANALAPRKRPRATLSPTLVTKDGAPYMAFGTSGGDCQDQWTLQFFLNHVVFGMAIQEALESPTVYSAHFPASFFPREAYPGHVVVEARMSGDTVNGLELLGHHVEKAEDWHNGKMMGIQYDATHGIIIGGASPRGNVGYALGW
jgi:gamma-glutamyltranspeptidase/glutathione hydrolase